MKKNASRQQKWPFFVLIGVTVFVFLSLLAWVLLFGNKAKAPIYTSSSNIKLNLYATDISFPTSIVSTPDINDNRLYVTEKSGQIKVLDESNQLKAQTFLDIRDKVMDSGESGLLGLTFDLNYVKNGYFYVNYINKNQQSIIARYEISSKNTADPNSEKILIRINQPYSNHNGGDLAFGPDGYLYIAIGDGGSAGDPGNSAQDKTTLLGKILRIDINKGDLYSIPDTNPFINQGNNKPEIWAYGLRNPWRISFDRQTGDLYIADVGQGDIEEINLQKAGSNGGTNYGWRCYEGAKTYNNQGCLSENNYTSPIFEYNHGESRCSITGGYVYRGIEYPTLNGKYFYGDFCGGQLYYAENKDGEWQQVLVAKTSYAITTFGQDSNGELYLADFNTGNIYKIVDQPQ
jgi:glucose/arabinose dehydrogenase